MSKDRVIAVMTDEYIDFRKVIVDHIAAVMGNAGYGTLCVAGHKLEQVGTSSQLAASCNNIFKLIEQVNLKGIICHSGALSQNVEISKHAYLEEFIARYKVPVISLGLDLSANASVVVDDADGMTHLMSHLLGDTTRTKFVFVRGLSRCPYSMAREKIFSKMIEQSDSARCFFIDGDYDALKSYQMVSELLSRERNIDVIVAANDLMALSAAKAVRAAGLSIPQDILISGFDDTPYATKNAPALTSVRQPLTEVATLCATKLLSEIEESTDSCAKNVRVNSELVVRGSTLTVTSKQDAQKVISAQWLTDKLESLMSGLPLPDNVSIEEYAQASWCTIKDGTDNLQGCFDKLFEKPILATEVHWWSNLCHQIESLTMQILEADDRQERMPLIRATLSSVREYIWSLSMDQEHEVQRLQVVQAKMQLQMSSCTKLNDILATMERWLCALGVKRCFVVQYEQPSPGYCETAELILVYHRGNNESPPKGKISSSLLLPPAYRSELRRGLLVMNPIYAGNDQFGYFLLDPQGLARLDIDSIAHSIGNAMRNQYLIKKLESRTTDLQEVNAELVQIANHDVLTGLPNRLRFQEHLLQCCEIAEESPFKVFLIFIDLDGFKLVNDSLGHGAGDRLLQMVAKNLANVISEVVGDQGFLARLGGDEFTVILKNKNNEGDIVMLTERLLETVTSTYVLNNEEVNISASIGCAKFPEHGDNAHALLKSADTAMYHAKETGKNCIVFYTAELEQTNESDLKLDQAMRIALTRGEFVMHFQPRIDIRTGKMCAVEALMRWIENTPDGDVSKCTPDVFIPISEKTGFIRALDKFAFEECCKAAKKWELAGTPLTVSVNLSVVQLQQNYFIELVRSILDETAVNPELVEFEITESAAMTDVEKNVAKLSQLREMGLQLSIDDFGTGYSSMNYLKRLPVNNLKIDRSFIKDITESNGGTTADAAIVRAIVALGKSMEFDLIAEGIESIEQLKFVESLGCDQAQGYYFYKPQPVEFINALLLDDSLNKKVA